MISEKIIELIHHDIDGQITSSGKDELHSYLRDHPEAESQYKQLQKTVNAIEDLDDVEPGFDLKDRILNSIKWKNSFRSQKSNTRYEFLPGIFANPRLRQVVTFSFGFVFCFLLITVLFKNPFKSPSSDPQLLLGTIGVERLDAYTLIDSLIFEIDLGSVSINQNVREGVNLIHVSVDRIQDVIVQFKYELSRLSFAGYFPVSQQSNRITKFNGTILVSSSSPSDYILVFNSFSNDKAKLEIEVSSDDNILINKTFIFNQDY